MKASIFTGPLAQLAAQIPFKDTVTDSISVWPTVIIIPLMKTKYILSAVIALLVVLTIAFGFRLPFWPHCLWVLPLQWYGQKWLYKKFSE